jgi:hypoxanthine phosphoribosyltransferase
MSKPDKTKLNLFISHEEIQKAVKKLGAQITKDYPENSEILVVVTLKGALFFAADLVREITHPIKIDFVRLTSYGSGTQSSGQVRILKDLEIDPRNKHLLILDEIIDTGRSLHFLLNHFSEVGAKSLKLCALLDKPSRREVQVEVDYIGMEIEDKFVVGYGLDYAEQYRHLKNIYYIES